MGMWLEKCQSKCKVNEYMIVHKKYKKINNRQGSHSSPPVDIHMYIKTFTWFKLLPDLEKTAFLLSISMTDFTKSIVKPRIKVGREYVQQGRNMQQVNFSVLYTSSV